MNTMYNIANYTNNIVNEIGFKIYNDENNKI